MTRQNKGICVFGEYILIVGGTNSISSVVLKWKVGDTAWSEFTADMPDYSSLFGLVNNNGILYASTNNGELLKY